MNKRLTMGGALSCSVDALERDACLKPGVGFGLQIKEQGPSPSRTAGFT